MNSSSDLVSWGIRSDVGRVRSINQDSAYATPDLFVVADGMGGHKGGEVASAVAIEAMVTGTGDPDSVDSLVERVRAANAAIIDRAHDDEALAGMGTTLCALAVLDRDWRGGTRLAMVNVGDSRIYRFADGGLEQVSRDHSLVAELVRDGHLTDDEAAVHPQRNIVTRALGIADRVDVDAWEVAGRRNERYLLCSDGLVNEVTDAQIAATMRRLDDPAEVVDELVRLANEAGARDNVTVVVVRIDAGDAGPADALSLTAAEPDMPAAAELRHAREAARHADPDDPAERLAVKTRRRGRVRAVLSSVVVVAILAGALTLIGVYARDNYFVGFEGEQVVIFQGRPGGVLWFDPTIEMPTAFLRSDLAPALEVELDAEPEFGTLSEAETYVAALQERLTAFSS